jgi:phosphate-selective porin
MFKKMTILAALAFCSLSARGSEGNWTTGYKEGGGGFYLKSPDDNFKLTLMGYVQAEQDWYLSQAYNVNQDYNLGFKVTRARTDFLATLYKNYEVLIEHDAQTAPGLLIAQITAKVVGDMFQVRAGKFVVPFSTEGYRSSRDFDTVNRHMTLNSLYFYSPGGQDVQYGVMLLGKLMESKLSWFASVVNGNASASDNAGAINNFKQFDGRVNYEASPDFKVGLAGQYARSQSADLGIYDLTYTAYNKIAGVGGNRYGFSSDVAAVFDKFSARAELIYMKWTDAVGTPTLLGGFAQAGYFVYGDKTQGFQPLLRVEYNKLTGPLSTPGANHLTAVLVGWQWYFNSNLRHQMNFISTFPGGETSGAYAANNTKYALLSSLQLKF